MTQAIEIARLSAATRRRLQELAGGKRLLHAPSSAAGGLIGAGFLALLAIGGAVLLYFLGAGAVDSSKPSHPLLAALGYGAAAALLWWTLVGVVHDVRQLGGGLPGGLFILPAGGLDVRAGRVRVINPDRIVRWESRIEGSGTAGMALIRVELVLDDDSRFGTVLFGTMANVAGAGLDELVARGAELRAARKKDDREAIARLVLVPDDELERAARFAAPASRSGRKVGTAIAGLLGAAAAYVLLLPALSLGEARKGRWIGLWDAVAASHPLPWVRAEADRARAGLRDRARAQVLARLAPPWKEALAPLLDAGLAKRRILVRPLAPAPAQVEAASKRLAEMAPAGTKAAPILLERVSSASLHGSGPVAGAVAAQLNEALGLNETAGALTFEGEEPPYGDDPRLEIAFTVDVGAVLSGEGDRVFAALALTFTPAAVVPGRPPVPLGEPIAAPPVTSMEVLRVNVGSLRQRALDSTGVYSIDAIEDSMVYVDQLDRAAKAAGANLAARLTGP